MIIYFFINRKEMQQEAIVYLFLLIIVEILAWYFLKKQHIEQNENYTLLFFFTFALIPWILIRLVKLEGIAITNTYWNIASTLLVLFLGYFIFKEELNNAQYIGIALGIVSIALITLG